MQTFLLLFLFLHFCNTQSFFINNNMLSMYRKLKKNVPVSYDPLDNKKLIVSTPAGLHGFYLMGISSYIKEHYNLTDYIFSGASAGSWNSLFLAFQGNNTEFIQRILDPQIYNVSTILQIEKNIKNSILTHYNSSDFDLSRINIGVSTLTFPFRVKLRIYNEFDTLEDSLNACIASSHIPFITGGLVHIYRKRLTFDGGLFSYPYVKYIRPSLFIMPSLWNSSLTNSNCSLRNFMNSHSTKVNVSELFEAGYNDSLQNKAYLDEIFL